MICDARNEASGFRAESWAEGRERSEDGADSRCLPTNSGVCVGRAPAGGLRSLPRRQPHQEGVTENWVSVESCGSDEGRDLSPLDTSFTASSTNRLRRERSLARYVHLLASPG